MKYIASHHALFSTDLKPTSILAPHSAWLNINITSRSALLRQRQRRVRRILPTEKPPLPNRLPPAQISGTHERTTRIRSSEPDDSRIKTHRGGRRGPGAEAADLVKALSQPQSHETVPESWIYFSRIAIPKNTSRLPETSKRRKLGSNDSHQPEKREPAEEEYQKFWPGSAAAPGLGAAGCRWKGKGRRVWGRDGIRPTLRRSRWPIGLVRNAISHGERKEGREGGREGDKYIKSGRWRVMNWQLREPVTTKRTNTSEIIRQS